MSKGFPFLSGPRIQSVNQSLKQAISSASSLGSLLSLIPYIAFSMQQFPQT